MLPKIEYFFLNLNLLLYFRECFCSLMYRNGGVFIFQWTLTTKCSLIKNSGPIQETAHIAASDTVLKTDLSCMSAKKE